MGRIKQNRGRRDDNGGDRSERQPGLHWVPLQQKCGCVTDWGFTKSVPPPAVIEWGMAMIDAPCVWHGAEGGVPPVPQDEKTVRLKGSPLGDILTQQVSEEPRRMLGMKLTRQGRYLKEATKDGVQGILVEVPEKYQRVMRAKGFDPVETWLQMRQLDIFMNLGRETLTPEMIAALPEPSR